MKGYIPEDKIDEIRNRVDIVSLVSEFVTLKKAGRNFLGLCPFHKEKTPSFTVNPDKQIFYCFGCGEGGNAISFLMKMNQMTFPEAVRYLAGKTGVIIPPKPMSAQDKEELGLREQISRINEQAAVYFAKTLFSPAGQAARSYLKERGIQEAAVREFRLGFAVDEWRYLRGHFEKQRIPLNVIEKAGLIIAGKDGSYYDRFRGRLLFPIEDVNGRVIAFGGRVLGNGEPKYLNSPESPLYTKGRNLYGLNRTREEIRRKGFAILVEGYFDLIALWNAGIKNCVATLGTALTEDQVALIKRYSNQVMAVFDPDEAGKKALARSLSLFLAGGVHARAVVLPEGYDPDTYVRMFGPEKFNKIIDDAQSMIDYYIENIIGRQGGTLEESYDALRNAVPFIAGIDDTIERNLFIKRVAERLGADQELLKAEVNSTLKKSAKTTPAQVVAKPVTKVDAVEFALIQAMVDWPAKISRMIDTHVLDYFLNEDLKLIGEELRDAFISGETIDAAQMMERIGDKALREKILQSMMGESIKDNAIIDRYINDTIRQIKKKWYRDKKRILQTEIMNAQEKGDQELCNRLSSEKASLSMEENAL